MRNLLTAQAWECPCVDRRNFIGSERIKIEALYNYRKAFQTTNISDGGKRDSTCKELDNHYFSASRTFSRSFVVGLLNDCCAAPTGLAKELAFKTFTRARVDVQKNQPLRAGRRMSKMEVESKERV
eukprot:1665225-Pleurochrysis_carterae.AAC.2